MGGCLNFGGGSLDRELEVILYFLRVKSEKRATSPLPPLIS